MPKTLDLQTRLQAALGDEFTIERELGGGGMSRVFLAMERSLARLVVIKLLPPQYAGPVAEERLRLELATAANLQHPHVVPVLATGSRDELLWFVMPFIAGDSLKETLERDGPLPVEQAVRILHEIADALEHAHRRGIIHRDIKPASILLSDGHAFLADFGIARVTSETAAQRARLTGTATVLGTLGYMAPEQLAGSDGVDARSDIYSLAVVGFEALTGRSPFLTVTGAAAAGPLSRARVTAPNAVRPKIPRAVSDAIMRALAPDPDARFASAAEFRDALRAAAPRNVTRMVLGVAPLAAVVLILLTQWRGNHPDDADVGPATRAENLVAVAPFEVLRPDLALWREGMVDVLSRNLDGVGSLRSVQPSAVIPRWKGRPDTSSAIALGKRVHAGWVVVGTLEAAGRDSVRALATLVDVRTGTIVAKLPYTADVLRIDRLADTLTVMLLRALKRDRVVAVRASAVRTRSLGALKAFLRGEQLHRRAQYDSASAAYLEAATTDSNFALAWHGYADARSWNPSDEHQDNGPRDAYLHAARLNHGLSRFDSLNVAADALSGTLPDPMDDYARESLVARLLAMRRQIVREYPDNAQAIYALADVYYHQGRVRAALTTDEQTSALFDRAIAADSGFAEPYVHAMSMHVADSLTLTAALPLAAGYVRRAPSGHWMTAVAGLRRAALEPERGGEAVLSVFATGANRDGVLFFLAALGVTPEAAILDTLVHSCDSGKLRLDGQACRAEVLEVWRTHGHMRRAAREDRVTLHSGAALQLRERLLSADSLRQLADLAVPGALAPDRLMIATALRDSARFERAAHALLAEFVPAFDSLNARAWTERVAAMRLLVQGNSKGAAKRFDATPLSAASAPVVFPAYADALAAAGREADALRLLCGYGRGPTSDRMPFFALQIARLAEKLGDRALAARNWRAVLSLWRDADPEFAPLVKEARDALDRDEGTVAVPAMKKG